MVFITPEATLKRPRVALYVCVCGMYKKNHDDEGEYGTYWYPGNQIPDENPG